MPEYESERPRSEEQRLYEEARKSLEPGRNSDGSRNLGFMPYDTEAARKAGLLGVKMTPEGTV